MTADAFFRMTVQDVFTIRGRGTVITGQIDSGSLKVGDEIYLSRANGYRWPVVVAGLEMIRKQVREVQAGDNVGVLLRDVEKKDIKMGDVLLGA